MSPQLVLFAEPRARRRDPQTSHDAARKQSGGVEALIILAFADYGAMCDDQLVDKLPQHYGPTVKSARSRLSKRGVLVRTGALRVSTRGCSQIVWTLSPREA